MIMIVGIHLVARAPTILFLSDDMGREEGGGGDSYATDFKAISIPSGVWVLRNMSPPIP